MFDMYNHQIVENKWQKFWLDNQTFKTIDNFDQPKFYALDMFPYPSGQGLHVGHPEGYTATDIISRYKRANGFNVLHPIGWDAFGLPAEQYAMKTGNNPADFTDQNIDTFRRQIQSLGFSYDWSREINTTDPMYYKWTQWIFEQLYEKGLAYEAEMMVNWDPIDGVVLANEEVVNGRSERSNNIVEKLKLRQWVLKITEYADRLIDDLEDLDWPEAIKDQQRNWIGRSIGATVDFKVDNSDQEITVFTTRPDTLFGVSYVVLAPENSLIEKIVDDEYKEAVSTYQKEVSVKTDLQRTDLNKEKSGVFTGAYAINPINQEKIQIWVADYVLNSYGTGAVMAVPTGDQRDAEFAQIHNLPVIEIFDGNQKLVNSDFLNGLDKQAAIDQAIEYIEKNKFGSKKINYRLRDWIFSRQRYWGEPIPVIHWEDGSTSLVPVDELPLLLPKTDDIKPSGTGESPLANLEEWLVVDGDKYGKPGIKGRRETNTMPQWAGSSWYYLRYIDPHNQKEIADPKKLEYFMPVDLYVGGAEHAVLHLLYARFWHKFLYDIGVVPTKEPFQKLVNQGMILGENHEKMSKSKGNVVNPDDIVEEFGADTLRIYEMFMGPLEQSKPWSTDNLSASRKWLDRVWRAFLDDDNNPSKFIKDSDDLDKPYHQTVKKVTEDIERMSFNTAISAMQIFINDVYKSESITKEHALGFIQLLAPFAPHISEEIWSLFQKSDTITYVKWPEFDDKYLEENTIEMPVQINGKVKTRIEVDSSFNQEQLMQFVEKSGEVNQVLAGQDVVKIIAIPGKIINIIAR